MIRGKNGRTAFKREPSRAVRQRRNIRSRGGSRRHIVRKKCIITAEQIGHNNIQLMMDFLANAESDVLDDMDYLQKLQTLLATCLDDVAFEAEFPLSSIESFRTASGRPLPEDKLGKAEQFRSRTLPLCARKLYDMLRGSSFSHHLSATYAAYGGRHKFYNDLYDIALTVAHYPRMHSAVS